jgi:3-oxoacyl-[acyl-carrier-protein] synthase I
MTPVAITATCVLCSGGRGTQQVWSTTRAGIARIGNSGVMDKNYDAIQMGLVPEDALPPLPPDIEAMGLPARARRMLRLAAPVLKDVAAEAGEGPHTMFTGLPQLDPAAAPWLANFHKLLGACAGVPVNVAASKAIPLGRAAALIAIEAGMKAIEQGTATSVIVGGVDTFLDLKLLAELDGEGRILGPKVMDGFIPGEGAAYLVLKSQAQAQGAGSGGPPIFAMGASSAPDPGHRYGSEPAKGEGLAKVLELLRAGLESPPAPVNTTFAGFNGENFDAKLWGVARLRHTDFFTPTMSMQHPASSIGDTGAACGAIMSSLAVAALARGDRTGPALVWAASDRESRACALIGTG